MSKPVDPAELSHVEYEVRHTHGEIASGNLTREEGASDLLAIGTTKQIDDEKFPVADRWEFIRQAARLAPSIGETHDLIVAAYGNYGQRALALDPETTMAKLVEDRAIFSSDKTVLVAIVSIGGPEALRSPSPASALATVLPFRAPQTPAAHKELKISGE